MVFIVDFDEFSIKHMQEAIRQSREVSKASPRDCKFMVHPDTLEAYKDALAVRMGEMSDPTRAALVSNPVFCGAPVVSSDKVAKNRVHFVTP